MEYKILKPRDSRYPKKLKERLGKECPEKIYYYGPLEFLDKFTMAIISSDIHGIGLMAANQVLFTIREYKMNYIGSHHSNMEAEIFRLGLWHKCLNTLTLFSSKGLQNESYESFLLDRFYPPMHTFPERNEYFRRAKDGELLMLSISEPDVKRQLRQNIIKRNWITCNLGDIVFIPCGEKGSKTFTMAKKLIKTNIPAFTTDSEENIDLHQLGIPVYNRKTVRKFIEERGAPILTKEDLNPMVYINMENPESKPAQTQQNQDKQQESIDKKENIQLTLGFPETS
ncbi:MAG: hypothetical protein HY738_23500 [Bacteroidia bacterium]|nr:hypothetical protein [Bacteroidia bacterium]